jgi:hypothetical protein
MKVVMESILGPIGTSVTTGLLYLLRVIVMMENWVEWRLAAETDVLGENLPQRHFVPPQIPHDQTRARTRAAAVGSAWAMARPR